jgi:acyl-CoA synthetase (AMP-forming)/AMP-acid ligase II
LAQTLARQPYPLLIFDDGVIAAASLWSHIREWAALFRLSGLQPSDRILLCLPSNRAFVCLACAALHEDLHLLVLAMPAQQTHPETLHRTLSEVQRIRPSRLCIIHEHILTSLATSFDSSDSSDSSNSSDFSTITSSENQSKACSLPPIITPTADHRPPELLCPLSLLPQKHSTQTNTPRIEGLEELLPSTEPFNTWSFNTWSLSDDELHALAERAQQFAHQPPPQHTASQSWSTRAGFLALVEGLFCGAEILRLPENASQDDCAVFAASYGITLPPLYQIGHAASKSA